MNRLIFVLLISLAVLLLAEGLLDVQGDGRPLIADPVLRFGAGLAAGLVIGGVAALLGVAGGELLIPTFVLLYGVDIRLAGSLSLAVSLPTMTVGLVRYGTAGAFDRLAREKCLLAWMSLGSVAGAAIGGMLLGIVSAHALTLLLGVVLAISAIKVFRHQAQDHRRAIRANDGRVETGLRYGGSVMPEEDTPRLAFDLLPLRVNVIVVVALASLSAVAWAGTIEQANSMRGMVMGLGQIGYRDVASMGAVGFLAMWSTMMASMMLPTIIPMVLAHHAVALRRWQSALSTPAFVTGYGLVWSAVGIAVWLAYWVFAQWGDNAAQSLWLSMLASAMLFFAGLYQLTRLKRRFADMCRNPLTFVFTHHSYRSVRGALRAGAVHGGYCLGCCGAAMMVLVVVGLTNLYGMAILFVLFLVEKNWKHGRAVANVAGIVMMTLGLATLAYPPLLTAVSN